MNVSKNENVVYPRGQINFKYYSVLLMLFSVMWLSSDVAAVKLVSVFGVTFTGGFFTFPLTTMFGSIISEVYGYKNARQAIWMGIFANLVFIFSLYIVYLLPSSPHWKLNDQFKNFLLPGARIVIASILSFFIAEFFNSYLMAKMKIYSGGQALFKRISVSCSVSFLLDLVLFLLMAFYGVMPNAVLISLIFYAYLKKITFQLLLYPLEYLIILYLKKKEGVEVYDYETNFNPFLYDNIYDMTQFSTAKPGVDQGGVGGRVLV